jgi:hypothetical protein
MRRPVVALLLLTAPLAVCADRIADMPRTERCVYTARLATAGYYYWLQGKPRDEVQIRWHGDETRNEIEFVTRTIDAAYARASALQQADAARMPPEREFGDQVYEACMAGREL